jgi:hypothetical protein
VGIGHNERILIFSSNMGLKILQTSVAWTADGTFEVVQPPFLQLYSIMEEIEGISYPCLFAFLLNKKASTYRALMEITHEFVTEKGELHLKQFIVDFEGPVIREFKAVFGRHILLTGCVIEYFQALIHEELDKVIETLDQNPEVKAEEADQMKESINTYLSYFEKTYIGRQGRAGFLKGRYPVSVWNQVENVTEGHQMSTNRHEGFHNRYRFVLFCLCLSLLSYVQLINHCFYLSLV